jgi:hypothetical protein
MTTRPTRRYSTITNISLDRDEPMDASDGTMTNTDLRDTVTALIHTRRDGNMSSVEIAEAVVAAVGKACAEVAKEMAAELDAHGEPQAELAAIELGDRILTLTEAAPDA